MSTSLPAAAYLSDAGRTVPEMKAALDAQRNFIANMIGGATREALTIASGTVTPYHTRSNVATTAAISAADRPKLASDWIVARCLLSGSHATELSQCDSRSARVMPALARLPLRRMCARSFPRPSARRPVRACLRWVCGQGWPSGGLMLERAGRSYTAQRRRVSTETPTIRADSPIDSLSSGLKACLVSMGSI